MPHDITDNEPHSIILKRQHFEKIPRQLRGRTIQVFKTQINLSLFRLNEHRGKLVGNQGLLHLAGKIQLFFHFLVLCLK